MRNIEKENLIKKIKPAKIFKGIIVVGMIVSVLISASACKESAAVEEQVEEQQQEEKGEVVITSETKETTGITRETIDETDEADSTGNEETSGKKDTPDITFPIKIKVLFLNYDPIIESEEGKRLHEIVGGVDPHLYVSTFIQEISNVSGKKVIYEVVEWIDIDSFVPYTDGFQYTDESFMRCWEDSGAPNYGWWDWPGWHAHEKDQATGMADYNWIINNNDLIERLNNGEIDEVFLSSHPFSGLYESLMVGKDAYWCNSQPIIRNDANKNFIIQGGFGYAHDYSYFEDYSVGCMLESFGHRVESVMEHIYGRWDYTIPYEQMNMWEKFTLYDKVFPGNAACGSVHYAPNSESDYDWGNERYVYSTCDDWLSYTNLTGEKKEVNCSEWGNGGIRSHHIWWLSHIPKADGFDSNGMLNNWWGYFTKLYTSY